MDETDYTSGSCVTICRVQKVAVTHCPFGEARFKSWVTHKRKPSGAHAIYAAIAQLAEQRAFTSTVGGS